MTRKGAKCISMKKVHTGLRSGPGNLEGKNSAVIFPRHQQNGRVPTRTVLMPNAGCVGLKTARREAAMKRTSGMSAAAYAAFFTTSLAQATASSFSGLPSIFSGAATTSAPSRSTFSPMASTAPQKWV